MSKTWRTIVVLGLPAIITIGFWVALGSRIDATIKASDLPLFGSAASISATGATALYIILLVVANHVYPLDRDELMPLRKKLQGSYDFKLTQENRDVEGSLQVEIDQKKGRLSIHGMTAAGNALVVEGRIILREDYLGFVIEVVPTGNSGGADATYFFEFALRANARHPVANTNRWYRLDGDGYGSLSISA